MEIFVYQGLMFQLYQLVNGSRLDFYKLVDSESMVYIYSRLLFNYKENMKLWIFRKMDGCGKY